MNFVERTFRLDAASGLGSKPRPELLGPVLTHLHSTLRDSVRMGFLHASRVRGRLPNALKAAAEVRYLGHSAANHDDSTLLTFEVPTFASAAPELFAQQRLWDDGPQPQDTAFELLSAWLHDVQTRQQASSRFDAGLLRRVGSYGKLVGKKHGLSRISLPDARTPQPAWIDTAVVHAARELAAATPAARRVRVVGTLDLIGISDRLLKLHLGDTVVAAVWQPEESVIDLARFLGREVLLEGEAIFRPSGTLLRIDADAIARAGSADGYFRTVPTASLAKVRANAAHTRPHETSDYRAIRGAISAEESDDEFAAAVDALY